MKFISFWIVSLRPVGELRLAQRKGWTMASSRRSLLFVLSLLGLAGGLAAAQAAKPFLSLPQTLTSQ